MRKPVPLMKLRAAERRVRLAKDVLKHIKANILEPRRDMYLYIPHDIMMNNYERAADAFIKEHGCQACAIGALFVADVMIRDRATMAQADSSIFRRDRLAKHFGKTQLAVIETAFELRSFNLFGKMAQRAISFGHRYKTADSRMVAIMNNIIKNRGSFVP